MTAQPQRTPDDLVVEEYVLAEVPGRGRIAAILSDQRVRFLATGAFNTAFAFAVFALLQTLFGSVVGYLVVLLIAHVVGVLEAFVVYRLTVFRVRGNVLQDLARFETVYLVALAVNLALLPLLVEVVGLEVLVSQGLIVVVTSLLSFFGHRDFSFRRPEVQS